MQRKLVWTHEVSSMDALAININAVIDFESLRVEPCELNLETVSKPGFIIFEGLVITTSTFDKIVKIFVHI